MSYTIQESGSHQPRLVTILREMSEEEPDVFLVTQGGEKIFTKRLLLAMFSPYLASLLSDIPANDTPGVTVPAHTDTLINTIKVIVDGKVTCDDEDDLKDIIDVGNLLGFSFTGLQQVPLRAEIEIVRKEPDVSNTSDKEKETIVNLYKHKLEIENSINLYKPNNLDHTCEVCNIKISSSTNFKNHMRNKHNTDVRTEPMSAYGAFLHEEKKEQMMSDPGGKLDLEQIRKKWKELCEDGKQKYRDLALEDKRRLGANYRLGRKRKPKFKTATENVLLCGRGCGSQFVYLEAWQLHKEVCTFKSRAV